MRLTQAPVPWETHHTALADVMQRRVAGALLLSLGLSACAGHRQAFDAHTAAPAKVMQTADECHVRQPDWVFCSSFEEAVSPWRDEYVDRNRIEDGGPHAIPGNRVARLRVAPGRGGAGFVADIPPHRSLYLRYYVKWEDGFAMTTAHHGPGGLMADTGDHFGQSGSRPNGTDFIAAGLEAGVEPPYPLYFYTYYHGMYQDCPPIEDTDPPPDRCYGDSLPCVYDKPGTVRYCRKPEHRPRSVHGINPGRWYCMEQQVDAGTPVLTPPNADGLLAFWIDDAPIGRFDRLWLRTADALQFNLLWLYLFYHAHHNDRGLLLDDVVVSTSRVGCRKS